MMPMASRMKGKASCASASVMIALSIQPPRKPATIPSVAPIRPPTTTAAKPTSSDTKAPPANASRRVRRERPTGAAVGAAGASSAGADAGIEDAIEQVDEEVDHDEEDGREEDRALHHGIVAVVDRLDREPPDARPREHGLGHDGAAQQGPELQPGDRHDG